MLNRLVLQRRVQEHIEENVGFIELATDSKRIEKVSSNLIKTVNNNLDKFVVNDDLESTYANIKEFSENMIVNYLLESSDIINDNTSSDYLKIRLLEEAGTYIIDRIPSKIKVFLEGKEKKIGIILGSVFGTGAFFTWLVKKEPIHDIEIPKIDFDNFRDINNPSSFDMFIPWKDREFSNADKFKEVLDEWKDKIGSIKDEISDKLTSNQYDIIKLDKIKIELDTALKKIMDVKIAKIPTVDEFYNPINQTANIVLTKSEKYRESIQNEIQSQIELINKHMDKLINDEDLGPVSKFVQSISDNGGVIATSLLLPALLLVGAFKKQDYLRIKYFDYKLDKYTQNLSRLGFSKQVEEFRNKAKIKQKQCENDIVKEKDKIKIDDTLVCYVKYSSSIIILILGILFQQCINMGLDVRNIKNVDQLLSLNNPKKDKAINEIATNAYNDYKDFIYTVYKKDKRIADRIINEINNGFKQNRS